MASLEERVSRLEAAQGDLATKSDLVELRSDIAKSKVEIIMWAVGVGIGIIVLNSSVTFIAVRLMG